MLSLNGKKREKVLQPYICVSFFLKKVMKVVVNSSSHEILFIKHGVHYLSK
jgi:hypothetical protein